jgi:hypothetical protein
LPPLECAAPVDHSPSRSSIAAGAKSAAARFGKGQLHRHVSVIGHGAFADDRRIDVPFARLVAVAWRPIMAGVARPKLTDASPLKFPDFGTQGLRALRLLRIPDSQRHDVVENNEVDAAKLFDDAIEPGAPFRRVEGRRVIEIFAA